ncbi:hypothetical protein INT45_013240 [Circinella minor]|uniref:Kinesin motor domain-containing protein n=1 Tax=Circinella minor TaxID=1195481 RepID=A0A8H7VP68_9FUNG|nr:hypothetical protein INT45_013240 [Circinella minor]
MPVSTQLPIKTSSTKPLSRHNYDVIINDKKNKQSIENITTTTKTVIPTATIKSTTVGEQRKQQQERSVQVALRVRPTEHVNETVSTWGKVITIAPFQKSFAFDHVFESTSTQEQVFRGTTLDLIGQVIDGRNATLLAYGEKSTGKSYSLGCTLNNYDNPENEGIIPRAAATLFDRLQQPNNQSLRPASTFTSSTSSTSLRAPRPTQSTSASARLRPVSMAAPPRRGSTPNLSNGTNAPRYTVRISFAQVYEDKLVDLLNNNNDDKRDKRNTTSFPFDRPVRNAQQNQHGIKEVVVRNTGDILRYLEMGVESSNQQKHTTVFTIILTQEKWVKKQQQEQQEQEQPISSSSATTSTSRIPMIASKSLPSKSSNALVASAKRRVSTLNVKAMVGQMEKINKEEEGEWVAQHSRLHFVDLSNPTSDNMEELFPLLSMPSNDPKLDGITEKEESRLIKLLQGSSTVSLLACINTEDLERTEKTVKYACRARNNKIDADYHYCEEWMKNDNPSFLRETIAKLQAEVQTLSKNDDEDDSIINSPSSFTSSSRLRHISSSSCSSANSDRISVGPSSSARTTITIPDTTNEMDAQHTVLADLRQQIEELQNEVAVTRERNRFVEKQLNSARKQQEQEQQQSSLSLSIATPTESTHPQDELTSKAENVKKEKEEEQKLSASELSSLKDLKASLARSIAREQAINGYIDAIEKKITSLTKDSNNNDTSASLELIRQIKQTCQKTDSKIIQSDTNQLQHELVESLKNAIQTKADRVDQLESQLTEAEKLRTELVNLREEQSAQIKQLTGSLSTAQEECTSLQEQLEQEQTKHQAVQQQSTEMIQALEVQLKEVSTENSQKERDLKDMKIKVDELQKHMWDQEKGTQLTLRRRFEELERVKLDLDCLRQVEEKQNMVIGNLDIKLDQMELLTQTLRQQLHEKDDYIDNLAKENKIKTQLVEEAQKMVNDVVRDVNKIGQERKKLDMTVQVLEGTLRRQDDCLTRSTDQLHELKHLYSAQTQEMQEKQQYIDELSTKKQKLEQELEETTTRASKSDDRARQLEIEVTNVQTALQQQINNVNRLEEEQIQTDIELQRTKALESRVEELDEELAKIHKDRDMGGDTEVTRTKNVAATDLDDVDIRGIITGLESRLQSLQKAQRVDQDEFDKRFERAVNELEETQKINRDQQRTIEALEASLKEMQIQLDETNASYTKKSKQVEALENQLSEDADDNASEVSSLGSSDLLRHMGDVPTTKESSSSVVDEDVSTNKQELLAKFREKLQDPKGQEELLKKLARLTEDNTQLATHVTDLEGQISLQRSKMTLETKNLELEVIRLTSAKNRLEKEMEQVMSTSSRNSKRVSNNNGLDSFTSPPQSPRVMSPTRDSRIPKSGSLRSLPEEELNNGRRISSQRNSRTRTASTSIFPPPTAPPSNPLPPVPTALPPIPAPSSSTSSHVNSVSSPPMSPTRSISSPILIRQNSSTTVTSGASEITSIDTDGLTSDRYERIIRSMQRKMRIAENDVKAHQDVISKLESQLSRSEHMVREVKKQLDVLSREKQASSIEIQNLRSQVNQTRSQHQSAALRTAEEYKTLEEELTRQRHLKDKAEKARLILENRMEELMSKKNKFMCF